MGSKLLLTIKSSKSKTIVPGPSGLKPLQMLKPSAHGIASKNTVRAVIVVAFCLDNFYMSI